MSIPTPFNPMGKLGKQLPAGYKLVESVYFDGSTYVDTGVTTATAPLYRADITAVVNTQRLSLIGANGNPPYSFIGLRSNGSIYAGTSTGYSGDISYSKRRCIWEFTQDGAYFDGVMIHDGGVAKTENNWKIMGCPFDASYYETEGVFYGLTLRNAVGELIAEYLPVCNVNTSEYLLWETVSKKLVRATKGQIKGGK